jgi:membrane fusion protein (multidrug efflux system)
MSETTTTETTTTPAPVKPARSGKARLRLPLMLGGIVILVVAGAFMWLSGGRYVSTDDAYVQADKLMVSTDVSGTVTDVDVKEGQRVHKGDVLFRLDPTPFRIALANAQSRLDQTVLDLKSMEQDYQRMLSDIAAQQAQANLAQTNFDRQQALLKIGGTPQMAVDQARATLQTSRATVGSLQNQASVQIAKLGGQVHMAIDEHPEYQQAKAARDEAQRQLEHTVVKAPFDGTVTQVSALQPGAMIISSMAAFMPTSAVALVSDSHVWADANLKETDLAYVRPGNRVTIDVDGVPDHIFHGVVDSVSPATGGAFSVLPSQNTSGNWVKVVQRVPVRIRFDANENTANLRAGMSATISIDTHHKRSVGDLF